MLTSCHACLRLEALKYAALQSSLYNASCKGQWKLPVDIMLHASTVDMTWCADTYCGHVNDLLHTKLSLAEIAKHLVYKPPTLALTSL